MGSLLFGGPEPTTSATKKTPFSHDIPKVEAAPSESKTETPSTSVDTSTTTSTSTSNVYPANAPKSVSSNAFANGANQNSGNFISDRPTTRVHAAPGGRSNMSSLLYVLKI